jgi:hypothetical protein
VGKALHNCFIHVEPDPKDGNNAKLKPHPVGEHISECYRTLFSFRNILVASEISQSGVRTGLSGEDVASSVQLPPHILAKLMQKRSYFQRQVGFLLNVLHRIVANLGNGDQSIPMRDLLTRLDYNQYYENKPLGGVQKTTRGS